MKNWFAGVAVTAGILLVMEPAMANPFDNTVPEDSNLTTVSKSVKLCEGFCNSMTVNQKAWSGGITEVRGFPGAEEERVFRFQAKEGFCGGDYDCSSDAKKWLKRRAEVITKNKSNGATRRNAFILFFFSAFFKLTSKGIPSVVKICFVSELIKK